MIWLEIKRCKVLGIIMKYRNMFLQTGKKKQSSTHWWKYRYASLFIKHQEKLMRKSWENPEKNTFFRTFPDLATEKIFWITILLHCAQKLWKFIKCNLKKWKEDYRLFWQFLKRLKKLFLEKSNDTKFWASQWNTFFCKEIII